MPERNVFLARQPIFDRRLSVYGYELLSRSGPENVFAGLDADRASMGVISDSLSVHRLDTLTGNRQAFINVTGQLLTEGYVRVLPRDSVVLEVLETVEPSAEVIAACKALKREGYIIALDDFVPSPSWDPLVAVADIIKIDFVLTTGAERRAIHDRYAAPERILLAEKVETHEDLREALDIGYSLFQGFFFCKPEILARRDISQLKFNYLRFLRELSKPELDLDAIEDVVKHEVSLSFKLLRYLNSVIVGLRSEIASIRHALVYLGERRLRRWGALVALSALGDDTTSELIVTSLVRARLCELLAASVGRRLSDAAPFLTGLLSTLDALVGRPMDEILREVAVSRAIESAIRGDDTPLGQLLTAVVALERGHWDKSLELAGRLGIAEATVASSYTEALAWVGEIVAPDRAAA